jgi:hypothetical protein
MLYKELLQRDAEGNGMNDIKVQSEEMESAMIDELKKKKAISMGKVYDHFVIGKTGLRGTSLGKCKALEDVRKNH